MTLQSREYLFHVTVASHKKDPVEISGEYPKNRKNQKYVFTNKQDRAILTLRKPGSWQGAAPAERMSLHEGRICVPGRGRNRNQKCGRYPGWGGGGTGGICPGQGQ